MLTACQVSNNFVLKKRNYRVALASKIGAIGVLFPKTKKRSRAAKADFCGNAL